MIVYERNLWEPVERYLFRSTRGRTPFCEVTRQGDGWAVLFYRGATHPGPHPYDDFDRAKAHIMRYAVPREEALRGEDACWATANAAPTTPRPGLQTQHPRRARRRSPL